MCFEINARYKCVSNSRLHHRGRGSLIENQKRNYRRFTTNGAVVCVLIILYRSLKNNQIESKRHELQQWRRQQLEIYFIEVVHLIKWKFSLNISKSSNNEFHYRTHLTPSCIWQNAWMSQITKIYSNAS